jgi:hypothetical protein
VLFVFLLEILTGDKGPKPKVFWHARKKRSQASQEVRRATSQVSNPVPHPPSPSIVPDMLPEPSTLVTSPLAPSISVSEASAPSGILGAQPDDVVMKPSMASPEALRKLKLSNQTFAHMFLKNSMDQLQERMIRWLTEAQQWGFNMGQVLNAVLASGNGGFIRE